MSQMLLEPVELTAAEIDSVSAGALLARQNLISIQVEKVITNSLNNLTVDVNIDITRNVVRIL